ncbi:cytochrome C oxidase subunit IV family protein [Flavisolibacter nicotianae]|uniref:cytochrome C oxidase subunit IV family protein n=1 Tax=Flavisolibacter nicotianae TaxID=2364882 RepID=UPI000EABEA2B|nr:cytochrome C oxidase subunit IV family protein [Flavisolibacter nicotianae]
MEQHTSSSEITFHHEPAEGTKRIWKTFWLLLIITLIELALGFTMYLFHGSLSHGVVLFLKGVIVILSLAKAFYIVSIFMHLGDELRNMIMTVVVPLTLFIWFIGAFLWDGNAYRTNRNRYDPSMEYKTTQAPVEKKDTTVAPLQ